MSIAKQNIFVKVTACLITRQNCVKSYIKTFIIVCNPINLIIVPTCIFISLHRLLTLLHSRIYAINIEYSYQLEGIHYLNYFMIVLRWVYCVKWKASRRFAGRSRAARPATCHLRGNVDKNRAAYVTSCVPPLSTPRPALLSSHRSTTFYSATFARSSIRVIRLISFLNCADVRLFYFLIL